MIDTAAKNINIDEYLPVNPWQYVGNSAGYDFKDWDVLTFQDCRLTRPTGRLDNGLMKISTTQLY